MCVSHDERGLRQIRSKTARAARTRYKRAHSTSRSPGLWRNNAAGASEVLTSMLWMCSVDLWTAFVCITEFQSCTEAGYMSRFEEGARVRVQALHLTWLFRNSLSYVNSLPV